MLLDESVGMLELRPPRCRSAAARLLRPIELRSTLIRGQLAANNPELLRPELAQAQKTLEAALDVACVSDVKHANTAELIRIDETLAIASAAAKEAISVRQRLSEEREQGQKVPEIHRRFEDANSVRWDAFAVYPSRETAGRAELPDPFQHGWLSFDSGAVTRRLAPIPDEWEQASEDGLRRLCEKAEVAPRREP